MSSLSLHRFARLAVLVLVICSLASAVRGQASIYGQWSPPIDWNILNPNQAFAHAVLLPTGPVAGRVLIWYEDFATFGSTSYITDPTAGPGFPSHGATAGANIFCASHTVRLDGRVQTCGGLPGPNPNPPPPLTCVNVPYNPIPYPACPPGPGLPPWTPPGQQCADCWPCRLIRDSWLYDPGIVTPGWTQLPSMNQSRFYPSQVAVPGGLLPGLAAGDPIVIGGTEDFNCGIEDPNPALWPQANTLNGRNLDKRYLRGWEYPTPAGFVQAGPSAGQVNWPAFVPGPAWPPSAQQPYFRFFPQTFLLAGQPAKIFIAGDTHFQTFFTPFPNPPTAQPCFTDWQVPNVCRASYKLDIAASTITQAAPNATYTADVVDRFYSSAVIMNTLTRTNRILRFGGSQGPVFGSYPLGHPFSPSPGTSSVEEWDDLLGKWVNKAPLAQPRLYQNAVLLPSGQILVSGGSSADDQNLTAPVLPTTCSELYDPGTGPTVGSGATLRVGATPRPRLYHSVAVLIPDGRVISLGGQDYTVGTNPPISRDSAELYSPPYLFQGGRPVVNSITSTSATYGQQVRLNMSFVTHFGANIKVVLIRPGSVTHHIDFDQRYVELNVFPNVISTFPQIITVVMPPDATYAPPGYYMLFVDQSSAAGWIPSVATIIKLS
jgi:hypothetical protein